MTEKIYENDSMLRTCTATVTRCTPKGDGYLVILDRTIVFPEGGGQLSDEGMLDDAKISYAEEINDEVIHHTNKEFKVGDEVTVTLDWNVRLDHMQQHCGEHILSYAFWKECAANNIGFHMNKDIVTIDLDKELTDEDMLKAENFANAELWADKPVSINYVQDTELATLNMRKKNEKLHGLLRIISIPGGDICTCCGTHPTSTGMIGMIKILRFEKHKGGVRVEFNCGLRALRDMQLRNSKIVEAGNLLSVKPEEVPIAIVKLKDDVLDLISKVKAKTLELFSRQIPQILQDATITASGDKLVCIAQSCDAKEAKSLMQLLTAESNTIVGIVYQNGDKVNYQFGLGEAATGNCKKYCLAANKIFGGKGGGNETFAQGGAGFSEDWLEKVGQLQALMLGDN